MIDLSDELIQKRKLYLIGGINFKNIKPIIQGLHYLNDGTGNDAYLYISSDGGYDDAGIAVIETMWTMDYDINTIILGDCQSMAPVIAIAGTVGKRWMTKKAAIMMHETRLEYNREEEKTISDLKTDIEDTKRTEKICCEIISKQTGKSIKEASAAWAQKDVWLTYKEALKGSIVDGLWTRAREMASNKLGKMKPAIKEINRSKKTSEGTIDDKQITPDKAQHAEPQRNDQNKV